MAETIDPPIFVHASPSVLGDLERAAAATEARDFCFHLRHAIDGVFLLLRPGRSFQFSEGKRLHAYRLALRAFEVGRALQPPHCGADVLERGLRALVGLIDVLTLSEDQRDCPHPRDCERAFTRTAKRLRKLLSAAQLAVDEEQADTDVDLPRLIDQHHLAGPPAVVLPFRSETRAAVERLKARRSHEAAVLWKRAEDYFRAADNLDDPATPYAAGLRLLSEGLAAGYQLSIESRTRIGIAMLGARSTIGRVFVPDVLPEAAFDALRARAHHVLDVLAMEVADRAQAEPEWIAGICAEASLHANVIANAAHMRTYHSAELSVRRHLAQQAG